MEAGFLLEVLVGADGGPGGGLMEDRWEAELWWHAWFAEAMVPLVDAGFLLEVPVGADGGPGGGLVEGRWEAGGWP